MARAFNKTIDFCNRSHVVFGGGELKNEHSSPIGNVGDRWLAITGKQPPLPQWDLGTILGNPMRCWKSQTPLEFSYLMRILAPARIPMGSWNSEGPQVFLGPQNSHISWNPHTLS